jgi:hypothetical protein
MCNEDFKDWRPTSAAINALPEPLRRFIHDLETQSDPAGMVRENVLVKEESRALRILLEEMRDGISG